MVNDAACTPCLRVWRVRVSSAYASSHDRVVIMFIRAWQCTRGDFPSSRRGDFDFRVRRFLSEPGPRFAPATLVGPRENSSKGARLESNAGAGPAQGMRVGFIVRQSRFVMTS